MNRNIYYSIEICILFFADLNLMSIQEYVVDRVQKYLDDNDEYVKELEKLCEKTRYIRCSTCNRYNSNMRRCASCYNTWNCVKCRTCNVCSKCERGTCYVCSRDSLCFDCYKLNKNE